MSCRSWKPSILLTAGLGQKMARKSINGALDKVLAGPDLGNWLDPAFQSQQDWPDYRAALSLLHRPEHPVDINDDSPVRRRLAYDELLAKQLAMALVRERNRGAGGQAYRPKATMFRTFCKARRFRRPERRRGRLKKSKQIWPRPTACRGFCKAMSVQVKPSSRPSPAPMPPKRVYRSR